ncbi:hypothetical protein [Fodinibius saliphilus]|uniref:hypothetical protein n=1 Tax=Fodinibius saliphilus TaxID=1920650 RepID=UPI0011087B58|nr:hypothetical protein [Fodinibius saliphilus]
MSTRELLRNLQILGGSIALLTIAGTGYIIGMALRHYKKPRDRNSIDKWTGKIRNLKYVEEKEDLAETVIADLTTKDGDVLVFLGPAWYINHQKKQLKKGDKITAFGSKVELEGQPLIIASQIIHDSTKLILRDETGMPYWDNCGKTDD